MEVWSMRGGESGELLIMQLFGKMHWLSEQMQEWKRINYAWKNGMEIFASKRLQLGELQSAFAVFITALFEYARFMKQDYYTKKLCVQEKTTKKDNVHISIWQSKSMR